MTGMPERAADWTAKAIEGWETGCEEDCCRVRPCTVMWETPA